MEDHEMDQAIETFADAASREWMAIYKRAISAGFNEHQAFVLLQTYILSKNPYGIRPGDVFGPKTDDD